MSTDVKKHTAFYFLGWSFILAGLYVFCRFCYDAQNLPSKDFKDAMQVVINLCGMLFALSALFFTLDNLKLQRITLEQQNTAIEQQKEVIELQKNELKIQNTEAKASNEYFNQQNETLKAQQADTTFFNMLNLHNEIIKNIDIRRTSKNYLGVGLGARIKDTEERHTEYGRDCFKFFYTMYKKHYNKNKEIINTIKRITEAQNELYKSYQNDLGHYFRYLYNFIKFVDSSEIKDKHRYTNIIRAQLSSHELLMLFYNCLSNYGNEKFKPLIEKYHLLKNIPDDLIDKNHEDLYAKAAFNKE